MRVAVPAWNDRVSPVFDVATRVVVFTVQGGAVTARSCRRLDGTQRAAGLSAMGVEVLLCSAISRALETDLRAVGIEVVSEVCGPVDDVLHAYLNGDLADGRLHTPAHARRPGGGARRTTTCEENVHGAPSMHGLRADGSELERSEDGGAGRDPRNAEAGGEIGGC